MKALTIWRPWSAAIVHGPKRIENRDWTPPPSMLGEYIAIHAGKRYDDEVTILPGFDVPEDEECPMGIVGVARILGWLDLRGARTWKPAVGCPWDSPEGPRVTERLAKLDADPYWAGPCGWLLGDVQAVEPIACRGSQKLWTLRRPEYLELRRRWRVAREEAAHA